MGTKNFSNADYVHFHVHSEYSAFDGLSKIGEINKDEVDNNLVLKARQMGFPGMALTDHGVVSGWIKFIKACTATKDKKGQEIPYKPIKPILGTEFYLARKQEWKNKELQPDGKSGNRHLNVYARNWEGYQNLCALSEKSWLDGFYHSPRIDMELLAKHSKGLMVGSACLSSLINANLLNNRYDHAAKACSIMKDIFGENFFLEIMYHGIAEEGYIIPDIFKLSTSLDIPILATNDCHYINKEDALSQEVLMCMSTSKCLNDPAHYHFPYQEFYLKSANEMGKIFGHAPKTLYNSVMMMERIDEVDIAKNLFGGMRLPKLELPEGVNTPLEYLTILANEGMRKIGWDQSREHMDRLNMELSDIKVALDINNYDFASYFIIVWDYVNYAKKQGIVSGCGRGSGYSSVLLRALGVTYGVDPIEYGLLWERFLGFDTRRFVIESDFGFDKEIVDISDIQTVEFDDDSDVDDERPVEEDFGGVDRY